MRVGLVSTLAVAVVTDALVTARAVEEGHDLDRATVSPSRKARSRRSLDDEAVGHCPRASAAAKGEVYY